MFALSPRGSCCMRSSLQPSSAQVSTYAAAPPSARVEQSCILEDTSVDMTISVGHLN